MENTLILYPIGIDLCINYTFPVTDSSAVIDCIECNLMVFIMSISTEDVA